MKLYADYTFYAERYGGSMKEADFERYALSASQYIQNVTHGKSDGYDGDELKYATCESADTLFSVGQASSNSFKEKKSENTDGYSVTYVTEGKDGETSEELTERKVYGIVRKWLLSTGLLYAGARCGHVNKCIDHYI